MQIGLAIYKKIYEKTGESGIAKIILEQYLKNSHQEITIYLKTITKGSTYIIDIDNNISNKKLYDILRDKNIFKIEFGDTLIKLHQDFGRIIIPNISDYNISDYNIENHDTIYLIPIIGKNLRGRKINYDKKWRLHTWLKTKCNKKKNCSCYLK